jgi:hypothetical protein
MIVVMDLDSAAGSILLAIGLSGAAGATPITEIPAGVRPIEEPGVARRS